MEFYLLKSTAILAIFWILYIVFLERESIHRFKRFYLLTSLVAAICIPLISIPEYVYVQPLDGNLFLNEAIPFVALEPLKIIEAPFWNLERILWAIYSIGVAVFAFRFFKNLTQVLKTINTNEKQKEASITFVLLRQLINPHTFFNYIFLNKSKFENNALPKEVILHEETHAKQKHSLDVLFIELLQIVLWFQPFIWLYKTRIKLNHEFLADQAVIKKGFEPVNYQKTLLSYSSNDEDFILANAINYSSIKKRFTVMKTQTSKSKIWLLSLLTLTILGILAYSFSDREIIEIEEGQQDSLSAQVSNENTVLNKKTEASQILMNEYKDFIKKFKETNTIYGDAYERAMIIYDQLMDDAQRASVEKYPDRIIPMPNLSKIKPRKPTSTQFEAFKNAKEYAIWIDNKHVSNSELNYYKVEDFVHVSGSRVFKNARSKKFPQPNQYHLFTKKGFKITYKDSQLKKYKKATEIYHQAIQDYLKGSQKSDYELRILRAKALNIYKTFSTEEIKKNDIKKPVPVPSNSFGDKKTIQQKPPTAKEITEYNTWAKKTKKELFKVEEERKKGNIIKYPIDNQQDLIKHQEIYSRMSDAQKRNATPNPLSDKSLHHILYPKSSTKTNDKIESYQNENKVYNNQQKTPTAKEIAEYIAWAKKMKAKFKKMPESEKVNGYPHMINDETFRYYNSIYDRMSNTQKNTAESLPEAVLVTEWPMPTAVIVDNVSKQQKIPTKKEVEEYNAWAKKLKKETLKAQENERKSLTAEYPIVKQKDLVRYVSIYKRMTPQQKANSVKLPIADEELKNTGLKFPPPPPPQQKPLSTKEITNYNTWARALNQKIKKAEQNKDNYDYPIIKLKDINQYKSIYNRLSSKQKINAEAFPNIPPLPPPPTKVKQYKNGKKKTLEYIIKNTRKDAKSGYEVLDNGESHYYIIYKGKKTYYNKDGYVTDDKGNVLPPPPPPPIPQGKVTDSQIKAYNKWVKEIKNEDVVYNNIKKEDYKYFMSIYNRMTDSQQKSSAGLPPPPPPAPKKSKSKGGPNAADYTNSNYGCLEVPKSFLTKNGNTLNISCIAEYPNNKFQIYNRWGNMIYSKDNYDNSWNGNVDKKYAREGSDKPVAGTYYYVIESPKLDKQKVGYLLINTDKSTIKTSNLDVEDYKKKYRIYKKLQDTAPHYIKKSNSEKLKMDALFSDLGGMYFRLSKENKKLVERPIAPIRPYVKITLDGKTYYKKFKELTKEEKETLPPPPPPIMKKNK